MADGLGEGAWVMGGGGGSLWGVSRGSGACFQSNNQDTCLSKNDLKKFFACQLEHECLNTAHDQIRSTAL